MSERLTLVFGLLLLGGAPLAAQDSLATLRRMEARLDSLVAAARDSAAADAAARATDTVSAGLIRVATTASFVPVLATAVAEAWDTVLAEFGAAALAIDTLPVIAFGVPDTPAPGPSAVPELARSFARMSMAAIWRRQDPALVGWASTYAPTGGLSASALAELARQVATTPARPNRGCLGGDPAACAVALGLRVGPDTLAEWYAPDAWPGLADRYTSGATGTDATERDRCAAGDSAACRAFLLPERLSPPSSGLGRLYLLQLALDLGGTGAIGRLCEGADLPIETRLEAASRVPIDTLLGAWADSVRAAMPGTPAPPPGDAVLVVTWCALLLGLALGGQRWR